MNELVLTELGWRVYRKPNGDLVDAQGRLLTLNEEANVRAILAIKASPSPADIQL